MKYTAMPVEVLQKIVNFLSARPYSEVSELLAEIAKSAVNVTATPAPAEPANEEPK